MVKSGSGGSRYVVEFSIGGSGKKDLQEIDGLFDRIAKSMNLADAAHLEEVFRGIGEQGERMMEFGMKGIELYAKGFETLVEKGSEFEQMLLRIQATGKTGEESRRMMKEAIKFTSELPITEADSVRILTTLATAHVNAMDNMGESYAKLAAQGKTLKDLPQIMGMDKMEKTGPKAITVITDVIAAMGHLGSAYQGMAIHELMEFVETGMARSPRTFGPMISEVRKLGKTAHTAKDRLIGLQHILEHRGALGISQAAMNTWGGIMSNFRGLLDKITVAVMDPGAPGGLMTTLNKGFKSLYDTVAGFFDEGTEEGKQFLSMLKDVGGWLVDKVVRGVNLLGSALSTVFRWMSQHPVVVKLATALGLVGSIAMVATGAIISLGAAIGVATFAVVAIGEALLPLTLAFAAIGAGIALTLGLFAAMNYNLGGIEASFENAGLVVHALSEAFENWGGTVTTISAKTKGDLERAGMLDIFLRFIGGIREAQVTWDAFINRFRQHGPELEDTFDKVSEAAGNVWTNIRQILVDLGFLPETMNDTVDSAVGRGQEWADSLSRIITKVGDITAGVLKMGASAMPTVADMIDGFASLYEGISMVKNGLQIVAGLLYTIFESPNILLSKLGLLSEANTQMAMAGVEMMKTGTNNLQELENTIAALHNKAEGLRNRDDTSGIPYQSESHPWSGAPIPIDMPSYGFSAVPPGSYPSDQFGPSAPPAPAPTDNRPIQLNNTTVLQIDKDVLGRAVHNVMVDRRQRAGHLDTG